MEIWSSVVVVVSVRVSGESVAGIFVVAGNARWSSDVGYQWGSSTVQD